MIKTSFTELAEAVVKSGRVKAVILLGQTADLIERLPLFLRIISRFTEP